MGGNPRRFRQKINRLSPTLPYYTRYEAKKFTPYLPRPNVLYVVLGSIVCVYRRPFGYVRPYLYHFQSFAYLFRFVMGYCSALFSETKIEKNAVEMGFSVGGL